MRLGQKYSGTFLWLSVLDLGKKALRQNLLDQGPQADISSVHSTLREGCSRQRLPAGRCESGNLFIAAGTEHAIESMVGGVATGWAVLPDPAYHTLSSGVESALCQAAVVGAQGKDSMTTLSQAPRW